MAYVALYRKFRPPTFDDVKGQDHIVVTLKNQIKSDRIGHAYLFCGTRGTGKTSVAKIFARAVNCERPQDGNPCGECASCRAIAAGASMNVVEIDAASNNGVDNVREIIDEVSYSPTEGRYRVYIIDEVHMLSVGAFNALLKTLEEPPSYVIFILATTEVQKISVTILSRCQRYDFHRITADVIEERLRRVAAEEGIPAEDRALRYIARAADGSMRDGLSLLDQCAAFHFETELTYDKVLEVLGAVDTEVFDRLFSYIYKQDVEGAIRLLAEATAQGRDLTQFANDFVWYLRNLMLLQASDADGAEDAMDMSREHLAALKQIARETELETVLRYIRIFSELSAQLRYAVQKRVMFEVTLIRACRPQMEETNDAVEDRLRALEERDRRNTAALARLQAGGAAAQAPRQEEAGQIGEGPVRADTEHSPAEASEKEEAVRAAVPEEIREVVRDWEQYVGKLPISIRSYMRDPKPRLSLGENGTLQIVFSSQIRAESLREQADEIELLLQEETGKKIPVEIKYIPADERFEEHYIDLQAIHMDVVTEDNI